MIATTRHVGMAVALVSAMAFAGMASATKVTMDFDGLTGAAPVLGPGEYATNYYNGGCGSSYSGGSVSCGGPDYGVVWSANAVAFAQPGLTARYTGVANAPSGPNVLGIDKNIFGQPSGILMSVAAGFDTSLSFWYSTSALYSGVFVTVYDGVDGTGSVLATVNLDATAGYCVAGAQFSCWNPLTLDFDGTAHSVRFYDDLSNPRQFLLDNVSFNMSGSGPTVPEPATIGMFGLGALLIGLFVGLRRRFG